MSTSSVVSSAVSAIPGGGLITGAISFLLSLGIKGKTTHFSYETIWPKASAWGGAANAVYEVSFSPAQMALIFQHAQGRLLAAMNATWGLSANMSSSIAQTASQHPDATLFALFYLWIGTNIDASQPDTLRTYMEALYPQVFLQSINDAGLDSSGVINVGNVTSPSGPVSGATSANAGYSSLLIVGALLGAGLLLGRKRK